MRLELAIGEVAQHNTIEVVDNEDEVAIALEPEPGHSLVKHIVGRRNEIRDVRLQGFANGNTSVRAALDSSSDFGNLGVLLELFVVDITAPQLFQVVNNAPQP